MVLILIVKGIYDGEQVRLLEPVEIKGKRIVEIRFPDESSAKDQQSNAFRKARGVWKGNPEVNMILEELEKRWQQWRI